MNKILAERHIDLLPDKQVLLRIYEPWENGHYWKCILEIEWPGKREYSLNVVGVDKLDAILNAVKLARIYLTSKKEWKNGNLLWLEFKDLGLTVDLPPE